MRAVSCQGDPDTFEPMPESVDRCDHVPFARPDPLCIVDDPAGGLDPLLVVQSSRCRTSGTTQLFVEIIGELDTYTSRCITPGLADAFDSEHGVVLDVSGVSFLDSAGLRLLEGFGDAILGCAGRVSLHDPSRSVRRLVAMLGIATLDMCEPVTCRDRSLRYECPPGSDRRTWQWDEPCTPIGAPDIRSDVRLIELPGGREHRDRLRLTIDATMSRTEPLERQSEQGRSLLYTVCGELDTTAVAFAPWDRQRLDDIDCITVDMRDVTIIDSAGVRLIQQFAATAFRAGARFVLRDPSRTVTRVLDTLDITFDIEHHDPTRHSAPTAPHDRSIDRSRRRTHPRLTAVSVIDQPRSERPRR